MSTADDASVKTTHGVGEAALARIAAVADQCRSASADENFDLWTDGLTADQVDTLVETACLQAMGKHGPPFVPYPEIDVTQFSRHLVGSIARDINNLESFSTTVLSERLSDRLLASKYHEIKRRPGGAQYLEKNGLSTFAEYSKRCRLRPRAIRISFAPQRGTKRKARAAEPND